jgi:AraC-like DNA-binding protein
MLRVRGSLLARVRAGGEWGFRIAASREAAVHAVTTGPVWLMLEGEAPRRLDAGDVVLFPSGVTHVIASTPDAPARSWDREAKRAALNADGEILVGSAQGDVRFLCACYDYDRHVAHPLLAALPRTIIVRANCTEHDEIHRLLQLLEFELDHAAAGTATAVNRLLDLVLLNLLRQWITSADFSEAETGWLRAVGDPAVGAALAALHRRPDQPWSLEELASEVNVSRSTLARRFVALLGVAPLTYLARWRMEVAARALRDSNATVATIARDVGYASEFAFTRAFARAYGLPPGRYRAASSRPIATQ